MNLDLHSHSIKSDDGRAKVENYCEWIRKKELPLDGFVLTEHRQFDDESDYRNLEDEYGILILKASEVETDYGHVLIFGVNTDMRHAYDFGAINLSLDHVIEASERCGGMAVPCHPGRPNVGLAAHYHERGPVNSVTIIETRNGGSRAGEDEASIHLAEAYGYRGVGGSDAHLVSQIGKCATRFDTPIRNEADLVAALKNGDFEAVSCQT